MHLGIQMWWRRLAEDHIEHQNGEEREFKWLGLGMVVGARRAGLSISKTADLLGFSRTTISYFICLQRMVRNRENIQWAAVVWMKIVSTVQAAGGGVMVWGIYSWHTLGPLVPIEHCLNDKAYLSNVVDHVHPFMTTVYPSSDGYFQQDNAPCHKAQIISDWFLEHENEFTLLKWPPQSPDLNPIEHLWDVVEREIRIMDVQPTNLQQLRDAILSTWTKISEECFQHLVKSMPQELRQFWRQNGVQPGTSKVHLIKWPVNVYVYIQVHLRKLEYGEKDIFFL